MEERNGKECTYEIVAGDAGFDRADVGEASTDHERNLGMDHRERNSRRA